ncbi:MAG: hypothetical protein A2822_00835 [Candidatus Staskawiczbacteria bacterium RIFCSPHIGHO2_01_FULL_41_41]|uniref:Uncharacterized protein n=1 Tax=Candidatus Staskawiczbacteria bacterium RIFCSPHIGHO2_01_FULL_41_41 TaxID=1802203 RepID=A0A1G2HRK2_9BACT|nr:MAG: hypothetical protein A2822_00835 [Candidatus Staskawiczbacteria bacterium RIFCSPHIGHO2_01_FULL_41_41]HLD79123.1 hypothetical protein [Candidatus Nanoarchaeia archaeon]
MPIPVERYLDSENLEIRLELPQGDSFILAGKQPDGRYQLSVVLPWYEGRHSTGAGICLQEDLDKDDVISLYESPTYELIAIVRKSLPALEELDREEDLDI